MRIVYDCSARAERGSPSLNDCLGTGPALQNKLWDVLVRGRFRPVILAADMKKAFLQVRIRKEDRDALRFHWLQNTNSNAVMSLRFTRALFGLVSSPFLLEGGIEQHLANWASRLPDRVNETSRDLYVDYLISGAHMAANIVDNVRRALKGFPVTSVHGWTDSTVTLHWISGNGEYRQFVENRVRKILEHNIDACRHVPSAENPADLASRGGSVVDHDLWWNGPPWLSKPEMWPTNPATGPSTESATESKLIREVIAHVAVSERDGFDDLPEQEPWREENVTLRKRARHLRSCKEALWKRWRGEYLTALRERNHSNKKNKVISPAVGDVVIVRSDERNRGKWPLGIVEEFFPGRDGIVRAVKLRCGKSNLERAVHHLYPLELKREVKKPSKDDRLDPKAMPFRLKRDAAVAAELRVEELANDDN